MYEDDARIGHQEFDLKLTQRVKMSMVSREKPWIVLRLLMGTDHFYCRLPGWRSRDVIQFLGCEISRKRYEVQVVHSSISLYSLIYHNLLITMMRIGYKVGRVDQAETALGAEMRLAADKKSSKAKKTAEDKGKDKIVRRELNKVYTNGTLVDAELLTDEQAGHCLSIREEEAEDDKVDRNDKQSFGICVLDSATSEFNLSAFQDDVCRTRLETLMRQLRPKEIIFTKVSS